MESTFHEVLTMALSIKNNTHDLRLYNNPFGTNLQEKISVLKENLAEETHFLPKNDKATLDEVQKAVVEFNSQNASVRYENVNLPKAENNKGTTSEAATGIGMNCIRKLLKEYADIDLQGIPTPIDILNALANGLLNKLGTSGKQYYEIIRNAISNVENLVNGATSGLDAFVKGFVGGFSIVAKAILNIPATILGTLCEGGAAIFKTIFGEKVGTIVGGLLIVLLVPVGIVTDFILGAPMALINHKIRMGGLDERIPEIVEKAIAYQIDKIFIPIANKILVQCGEKELKIPEPPKQEEESKFVRVLKNILSFGQRERCNKEYKAAVEQKSKEYMKNNPEKCGQFAEKEITRIFTVVANALKKKITEKGIKEFNKLQNRTTLFMNDIKKLDNDIRTCKNEQETIRLEEEKAKKYDQIVKEIEEYSNKFADFLPEKEHNQLEEIQNSAYAYTERSACLKLMTFLKELREFTKIASKTQSQSKDPVHRLPEHYCKKQAKIAYEMIPKLQKEFDILMASISDGTFKRLPLNYQNIYCTIKTVFLETKEKVITNYNRYYGK
ncbi:MAG: hypothetical protein MJ231_08705 [bacterium]|nr:hypothetical protein [bacterium]